MLVLTRKLNESIMIGDVEVKVTSLKGDYVKLGIKAPREVPIHRKEIYDLIQKENREAAQTALSDISDLSSLFTPKEKASE
ncbi:carbon storage regulator CsrA [bacterium]|nr:carbon storage regulator CsrA [candidate division CSSED10-310 bacterium]